MKTIKVYLEPVTNFGCSMPEHEQKAMDAAYAALIRERVGAAFPDHEIQIARNLGGWAPGSDGARTVDAPEGVDADDIRTIVGACWQEVCERWEEITAA